MNFEFRDVQVLSEEQVEQVKRTEEQIYDQLALIPPNGPRFVENVMHIIKVINILLSLWYFG